MANYLLFIVFSKHSFLSQVQLCNIHNNLGHPLVKRPVRVVERTKLSDLPRDSRGQLKEIVKYCHAGHLKGGKQRSVLFFVKEPIIGEFFSNPQLYIVKRCGGTVLHIIDVEISFKNVFYQ